MQRDLVTVERFYTSQTGPLQLRLLAGASGLKRPIREPTVNRPGLALAGFTKYFAGKRVQAVGAAEVTYLKSLPREERHQRYELLFSHKMPCVVFSRNLKPDRDFLRAAEAANVPIFQSPLITMKFINLATLALEAMFAPKGTDIGSMVDILGVGVIVRGESGIGKSECVLALIERGYSLVSDDITKVTLLDGREVVGTSAELTRNHMEVRGIGIINVASVFGIGSIRIEKRLDLVVTLEEWENVEEIERVGIERESYEILGLKVPHVTIPVRPGRDIARLIEVAAMDQKLKGLGQNSAVDFNAKLLNLMEPRSTNGPA